MTVCRRRGSRARDDLAAAATGAPMVARVRAFVDWVGAGRAVTQAGRLRRADALELVELLETGDVIDQRFPIQSSAELYRLTLLVELAKACGLVRVVRGRIVAVSKNAWLRQRPVDLVVRLLAAVPRLGDELGHSVVTAAATDSVEAVLGDLIGQGGTVTLERASEVAWSTATRQYWFPDATATQLEFQRRIAHGDVRRILDTVAGLGALEVTDAMVSLTPLGRRTVGEWLGLGTQESDTLQIKVTLQESADPEVWRRLRVSADIRLDRFHRVLGAAMGWQDCHLHVFERGPIRYGFPDPDLEIHDDRDVTLEALLVRSGDWLEYEYDFGDSWQHAIVLEVVERADGDGPRCIDGAGRCPPEDVGGIPGYEELRRVLAGPDTEARAEMLEWLGLEHPSQFDAGAFSLQEANDAIARMLVARSG